MSFEEHLLNGIPQAEAAEYFLRIRGKDKVAVNAAAFNAALAALPEAERAEILKTASAMTADVPPPGRLKAANMMGGPMPASATSLPATGRGMNMSPAPPAPLPPTAMGQQSMKMGAAEKSPEETGKERARASLTAEFEKEKAHRGEKRTGLALGALGAAGGAAAMHHYGKGNPLATLGGAALGHHIGKELGRDVGAGNDAHRHAKHAAAFKLALDAMGLNESGKGQQMAQQPAPGEEPVPQAAPAAAQPQAVEPRVPQAVQAWLEAQQAGDAAAEQSQAEFLRQKLEEARAAQTAAEEEAAALQEQQAAHDASQAQVQQQVQESIQQAAQAQDQVLQEQQAAAAMRMAFQQLRGQVLQIASTDPPALSSDAAALSAASTAAGPSSGPGGEANAPERGPAGQAPTPGTPNTPAPLGDETVTDKIQPNEPTFGNAEPSLSISTKEPQGDSAKPPGKEVLSHYRPLALRSLLPS